MQGLFFARLAFERSSGVKTPVTARGRKLVFWNDLRNCPSLKDRRHGLWTATARNVIPNDNAGNGLRGMPFPRLKSRGPIEAGVPALATLAGSRISATEESRPH